jgi:hypothetical protein
MRRHLDLDRLPAEMREFILATARKPGRPPGTSKFEEFDGDIIGFLNLYIIRPPRIINRRTGLRARYRFVSIEATIRELVTQIWHQMADNDERHRRIGQRISAAASRIFQRLPEHTGGFPAVTQRKRSWNRRQ